jgi:hypothetical protein
MEEMRKKIPRSGWVDLSKFWPCFDIDGVTAISIKL